MTYFCDHLFSESMAACSSGEGDCPVEVSSACKYAMNVEMAGWRYRTVGLPIFASLLLISSFSSLVRNQEIIKSQNLFLVYYETI
jgi:hypothetical protein